MKKTIRKLPTKRRTGAGRPKAVMKKEDAITYLEKKNKITKREIEIIEYIPNYTQEELERIKFVMREGKIYN